MQLTIQLAEAFLDQPNGVLSIHQVARKLGIPYGTAYNRIHQMGELGLVDIVPQGKAKLCSLNPTNPMTVALLSVGAAQATYRFLQEDTLAARIAARARLLFEEVLGDNLHGLILLNLQAFSRLSNVDVVSASQGILSIEGNSSDDDENVSPSVDFLVIIAPCEFPEDHIKAAVQTHFPPAIKPRITNMVVTPAILAGMLREHENEAGQAAFQLLRNGLILIGFERFFSIVLNAFASRRI